MRFRLKLIWLAFLFLFGSGLVLAQDFTTENVDDALNRAKNFESKINLPENKNPENKRAAAHTANKFHSIKYQKKIQAEIERLKKGQFSKVLKEYQHSWKNMSKSKRGLPINERIYVFISSSIPVNTLRSYVSALDKIDDPNISIVLKGFVRGMKLFRPTLDFVHRMNVKDTSCDLSKEKCNVYNASIIIDPMLFSKYRINVVPAITYVQGVNMVDATMSEGKGDNLTGSQESYTVYGDVSLEYALEKISIETKAEGITKVLRRLNDGYYDQAKSR